ncbi:carbohydrate-binding module family 48 protein [Atractiella rhizophila]|nr:carbohydrate-binding module family 48 protein [Atractiella rhizophila]
MSAGYEHEFKWETDASTVIVTGTFDDWKSTVTLDKLESGGFSKKVTLPHSTKVLYKYVVDGVWKPNDSQPTERDDSGNVNNVFEVPAQSLHIPSVQEVAAAVPEPVANVFSAISQAAAATVAAISGPAPIDTPGSERTPDTPNDNELPGAYIPTPALESAESASKPVIEAVPEPTDPLKTLAAPAISPPDQSEVLPVKEEVAPTPASAPTEPAVEDRAPPAVEQDPLAAFEAPPIIPPEQAADLVPPKEETKADEPASTLAPPTEETKTDDASAPLASPATLAAIGAITNEDSLAPTEAAPAQEQKPVAEEPPKAVEEPAKPAVEAPKAVDEPPKAAEEPSKVAEEPPKIAEELPKAAEEPPKVPEEEPAKAAEEPAAVAAPAPAAEAPKPAIVEPKAEAAEASKEANSIPMPNGNEKEKEKDLLSTKSAARKRNSSRFSIRSEATTEDGSPRKRKTSIFQKIKAAVSPKKKDKESSKPTN